MFSNMRYSLYVLASALLTAVSLILTEIGLSGQQLSPPMLAIFTNLVGGAMLVIYYRKHAQVSTARKPGILLPLIAAAVTTYGLGPVYGYLGVQHIGAGKASILGLLETPFIIVLGLIFLSERLSARGWFAGGLALVGAFIIAFDPDALRFNWTTGEFYSLLGAFLFAVGIVASRRALGRLNAGWTTGLLLLVGSLVIVVCLPLLAVEVTFELSVNVVAIVVVVGILRGVVWLLFNSGVQQIGASSASILFLSHSFFTVILQAITVALFPDLGLQPPGNLLLSLVGGVFIALGVVVWETQSPAEVEREAGVSSAEVE